MGYSFSYKKFKEINLGDNFFDSLKNDYEEFEEWFRKKAEDYAYIQMIDGKIEGFLYLKIENGNITDITPNIKCDKAVKIGTMKINPHGTRLGERFIKKSLDFAINNNIRYIYVTVFEKHDKLINLYEKYGFSDYGTKKTNNGTEKALVKNLDLNFDDSILNYPKINFNSDIYLLGIYPDFHTRLFPDSILNNESFDIVKDVSHTNSIDKIYICRMQGISNLKKDDLILIYRTSDQKGPAAYRSVVTSICTVQDIKSTREFDCFQDYENYCKNYSVFNKRELQTFFNSRREYFIIKMSYNIAFPKKVIRKKLIEEVGIDENKYWGFFQLTEEQSKEIISMGQVNKNYVFR